MLVLLAVQWRRSSEIPGEDGFSPAGVCVNWMDPDDHVHQQQRYRHNKTQELVNKQVYLLRTGHENTAQYGIYGLTSCAFQWEKRSTGAQLDQNTKRGKGGLRYDTFVKLIQIVCIKDKTCRFSDNMFYGVGGNSHDCGKSPNMEKS